MFMAFLQSLLRYEKTPCLSWDATDKDFSLAYPSSWQLYTRWNKPFTHTFNKKRLRIDHWNALFVAVHSLLFLPYSLKQITERAAEKKSHALRLKPYARSSAIMKPLCQESKSSQMSKNTVPIIWLESRFDFQSTMDLISVDSQLYFLQKSSNTGENCHLLDQTLQIRKFSKLSSDDLQVDSSRYWIGLFSCEEC